jgi:hypothetical protein
MGGGMSEDLEVLKRRLVDRELVSIPVPPDGMLAFILLDSEVRAIIAALERAERVEKALRAVADEGCYFAVYGEGSETWRDCGKCGPCFAHAALSATPEAAS